MKNIIKIISVPYIMVFSALSSMAADATVSSSGNWSDASTWDGSAPGTSVDTLNFVSSGLQLTVDSNASAQQILLFEDDGYANNASI